MRLLSVTRRVSVLLFTHNISSRTNLSRSETRHQNRISPPTRFEWFKRTKSILYFPLFSIARAITVRRTGPAFRGTVPLPNSVDIVPGYIGRSRFGNVSLAPTAPAPFRSDGPANALSKMDTEHPVPSTQVGAAENHKQSERFPIRGPLINNIR